MEPLEWIALGAAGLIATGVGFGSYSALKSAGQGVQDALDSAGQGVSDAASQVSQGVNVALMLGGLALTLYALNKSKA